MNKIKLNPQGEVDITIPEETNLDVELKAYGISKLTWRESQQIAESHDKQMEENLFDILTKFCKDFPLHRGVQIMDWDIKEWINKNL